MTGSRGRSGPHPHLCAHNAATGCSLRLAGNTGNMRAAGHQAAACELPRAVLLELSRACARAAAEWPCSSRRASASETPPATTCYSSRWDDLLDADTTIPRQPLHAPRPLALMAKPGRMLRLLRVAVKSPGAAQSSGMARPSCSALYSA
ncbi:hypothetical protein SORBI_3004G172201 [Sorghum bicolor]|uniref:Uncharacterized protein n=1 Tax=Sorghum bicolor TaxID=4558 RepID=A0A1Z5RP01_SORBI|nr:hypothetical protein SORBI_3004G172201 [Sorghum bicolor]